MDSGKKPTYEELEHTIKKIKKEVQTLKKNRKSLRLSEQRLRSLIETTSDVIWEADQNDVLTYISPQIKEVLGYAPEEVIGKTLFDFMPPDVAQKVSIISREKKKTCAPLIQVESTAVHKDGHQVILETNAEPFFDEQGNLLGYRGIDRDITERKRTEEALRSSEERFSKAFHTNPSALCIVRVDGMKIKEVNESYCTITGYSREEIIGHTTLDVGIISPEEWERLTALFQGKGALRNIEFKFQTKYGDEGYALASFEPIILEEQPHYIVTVIDITERKKGEEALCSSEERFNKAFHTSPLGLSIARAADMKMVEVNETRCLQTGYGPEELIGHTALEVGILAPQDWDTFMNMVKENKSVKDIEFPYKTKSREERWGNISFTAITLRGEPHYLVTVMDISQRKKVEEALRSSEERFHKAFHTSPVGLSICRADNWKVMEVNETGCLQTGYSREEIIGHTAFQLGTLSSEDSNNFMTMAEEKGTLHNFEQRFVNKAGEERCGVVFFIPITLKEEPHYIVTVMDITDRKKAEEALKISEANYREIFNASNDALFIHDPQTGIILDVNQKVCELYKYSREEIIGQSIDNISSGENYYRHGEALRWINRASSDGPQVFEWHSKDSENKVFCVEVNLKRCVIRGGERILAAVRDITNRKKTEEALRSSEERFSKVFHTSPGSLSILRIADRKHVEVNDIFCVLSGFKNEEVIGHTAVELGMISSETAETFNTLLREKGAVRNIEFAFRTKSGEERHSLASLEPITLEGQPHYIVSSMDITERKRTEEALRSSEERFSKVFHASPVGLSIARADNLKFVDVNETGCMSVGYSREEIIGRTSLEMGTLSSEEWGKLSLLLKGKSASRNTEIKFRTKSEEERHALTSFEPVTLQGEPHYIVTVMDITERKQAEEEREKLIFKLRASLSEVKRLSGLLPICASCKKIRDDKGYWEQIESYIRDRSEVEFSHGICPECAKKLYADLGL